MPEFEDVTVQLRKEQLEIAKKMIQTDEVKIYRETSVQQKSFTIPITREELVIEKKDLTTSNNSSIPIEAMRILLSEEKVEFTKHKIALEDVTIYKQQIDDIKHIEATIKHEESKIDFLPTI